jgi:threonine dehydratase
MIRTVSERLDTHAYLKLELFQRTGSFKPRGAFNRLLRLTDAEKQQGVVAFSGGNFAQGVAYAGHILGIRTHVLMPEHTPRNYVEATRGYGAEIELVSSTQAMLDGANEYRRRGRTVVHPFDDHFMMAGNGTIGLELLEEVPDLTDAIVSIGGGGLMSGIVTAVKALKPTVRIWGVETDGADAMAQSLQAGKIVHISPTSIARTLGAPYVAEDALILAQRHLEDVTVVPDRDAVKALRFLLERAKVLAEPAASCTLAAAERLRDHFGRDHHVVLVLCGGNISLEDVCRFTDEYA